MTEEQQWEIAEGAIDQYEEGIYPDIETCVDEYIFSNNIQADDDGIRHGL